MGLFQNRVGKKKMSFYGEFFWAVQNMVQNKANLK